MSTQYNDWQAVADLTGCGKMHGAQGPAPTISEMVAEFHRHTEQQLRGSDSVDMIGSNPSSLIATLLARCQELRAEVEENEQSSPHQGTGMNKCHICGRDVIPTGETVRYPSCECHLQMAAMESALDQLVRLYIRNKGMDGEFIACITPPHWRWMTAEQRKNCPAWKAWDDARRALGEKL